MHVKIGIPLSLRIDDDLIQLPEGIAVNEGDEIFSWYSSF